MLFILHRLLRFLCGYIPALAMVALYHHATSGKAGRKNAMHLLGTHLFCLYLSAVFFVTDLPDLFHFRPETVVNLIPFDDIGTNTIQYFLNILLFVPLGFLLPMLWPKFEKKRLTFLCGAVLSAFIEVMQLFNYRSTDIDDLLMNTAGAVVGYYLFVGMKRRIPCLARFSTDSPSPWGKEPLLYALLAWGSAFFIQPILSGWLSGLLFGGRVIIG